MALPQRVTRSRTLLQLVATTGRHHASSGPSTTPAVIDYEILPNKFHKLPIEVSPRGKQGRPSSQLTQGTSSCTKSHIS